MRTLVTSVWTGEGGACECGGGRGAAAALGGVHAGHSGEHGGGEYFLLLN